MGTPHRNGYLDLQMLRDAASRLGRVRPGEVISHQREDLADEITNTERFTVSQAPVTVSVPVFREGDPVEPPSVLTQQLLSPSWVETESYRQ